VSEAPSLAHLSLDEITHQGGPAYPNEIPYKNITAAIVVWNDQTRLHRLLDHLRPYFNTLAVVVQTSPDATLSVAREFADIVETDDHRGYGDASFGPKLLPRIKSDWTFKVDVDEWPSEDLLQSLRSAAWLCEQRDSTRDGAWLPFHSSVDEIEYEEQHAHLRLFQTRIGWPATLHSRPPTNRTLLWHTGFVRHDRTLDEMMQDYLRYWDVGRGNSGWENHNRIMMYHACRGTAEKRGWDYVRAFEWWPKVEAIAFQEEKPWLQP